MTVSIQRQVRQNAVAIAELRTELSLLSNELSKRLPVRGGREPRQQEHRATTEEVQRNVRNVLNKEKNEEKKRPWWRRLGGGGETYIATHEFEATHPDDLGFAKGTRLVVTEKHGDWYSGHLECDPDKRGVFGKDFVTPLNREALTMAAPAPFPQINITYDSIVTVKPMQPILGGYHFPGAAQRNSEYCILTSAIGDIPAMTTVKVQPCDPAQGKCTATVVPSSNDCDTAAQTITINYPIATVAHDYESAQTGDLQLRAGETVRVVEDEGPWLRGASSSGTGLFPSSHVEYSAGVARLPFVTFQTNLYTVTQDGIISDDHGGAEFRLTVGETITRLSHANATTEWWYGEYKGQKGFYPASYVTFEPPEFGVLARLSDGMAVVFDLKNNHVGVVDSGWLCKGDGTMLTYDSAGTEQPGEACCSKVTGNCAVDDTPSQVLHGEVFHTNDPTWAPRSRSAEEERIKQHGEQPVRLAPEAAPSRSVFMDGCIDDAGNETTECNPQDEHSRMQRGLRPNDYVVERESSFKNPAATGAIGDTLYILGTPGIAQCDEVYYINRTALQKLLVRANAEMNAAAHIVREVCDYFKKLTMRKALRERGAGLDDEDFHDFHPAHITTVRDAVEAASTAGGTRAEDLYATLQNWHTQWSQKGNNRATLTEKVFIVMPHVAAHGNVSPSCSVAYNTARAPRAADTGREAAARRASKRKETKRVHEVQQRQRGARERTASEIEQHTRAQTLKLSRARKARRGGRHAGFLRQMQKGINF